MPTQWDYGQSLEGYDEAGSPRYAYRQHAAITCPTCDEQITFVANRTERQSGEEVASDGRTVSEVFRFIPGRGRYTTSCRECERTARQRAAATPAGDARLFGVEIECNVPQGTEYATVCEALAEAGIEVGRYDAYGEYRRGGDGAWVVKGDGSLGTYGVEVCSPPLSGRDGHDQVRTVCAVLEELGAEIDTRCGLHVHHDIRGARTTVDAVKRFCRSWYENQRLIDGLVSSSRRSCNDAYYCAGLTSRDIQRIESVRTLEELADGNVARYRAVNVNSYPVHGTIEIRQHQGTLDPEKISSWVRLGQAMLDDAEARQAARPRAASVQEMLVRMGSALDETARTFLIGRAVEFGHAQATAAAAA